MAVAKRVWVMLSAVLVVVGVSVAGPPGSSTDRAGASQAPEPEQGPDVSLFAQTLGTPVGITTGPDGNLWVTDWENSVIDKITPAGDVTTYSDPTISQPFGIAVSVDGEIWFTNRGNNLIGRITTSGVVTNYSDAGAHGATRIAAGVDGKMWFANDDGSWCSITPSDRGHCYTSIDHHNVRGIATAPGGDIWLTAAHAVIAHRQDGSMMAVDDPTIDGGLGIIAGPDGNIWFTNQGNSIGRVTSDGDVTMFSDPEIHNPVSIVAGPDGNLWFTNGWAETASVGRITPTGIVTIFHVDGMRWPYDITVGPAGDLFVADAGGGGIWRVTGLAPQTGDITGVVTGVGGDPVAGVIVRLFDGDMNLIAATSTDADGAYAFRGLDVADSYKVRAIPRGDDRYGVTFNGGAASAAAAQWVTVSAGVDTQVDVALRQVFAIHGTVTSGGSPLAGAKVVLRGPGGNAPTLARAFTDGAGNYSMVGLASATYVALAKTADGSGAVWYDGATRRADATVIDMTTPGDRRIDFSFNIGP